MRLIKNTLILSIATSNILFAATPNISDALKEVKPPKEVIKKKSETLIDIDGMNEYTPALKEFDDSKRVLIKEFVLEYAYSINIDELQGLISDYKNRMFTFQEMQNIASIITKYYRDNGYFVAKAYLPKQTMKDNTLKITIVEGQYGDFKLENNSYIKDSVIQGFLDNTKLDGTIRVASIEKASLTETLLLINDLPGVTISKANVRAGAKVGTSDFDIEASVDDRYDGYMVVDNYGGHYTGKNRLLAGANFNSPFALGDKISINGLVSDSTDLINGSLAYSIPLSYDGLIADISYSNTSYNLAEDYESLDAQGKAKTTTLGLDYPLLRSRLENLYTSFEISHSKLEDEIRSTSDNTDKNSKKATLSLEYDKSGILFNTQNQTKLSLAITYGKLEFEAQDKKDDDAIGANTQGNFSKINIDISENFYFTNSFYIESSLALQYALGNKNLDGSEDFSIGGSTGVKLYPSGELSAENGYLFNIEAKYQLPLLNSYSHTIGVFYDRGRAFMADNSKVNFEDRSLQDVGIGYYISYKDFFGQIQAVWKVDSKEITSEDDKNSRILFQGGWVF